MSTSPLVKRGWPLTPVNSKGLTIYHALYFLTMKSHQKEKKYSSPDSLPKPLRCILKSSKNAAAPKRRSAIRANSKHFNQALPLKKSKRQLVTIPAANQQH